MCVFEAQIPTPIWRAMLWISVHKWKIQRETASMVSPLHTSAQMICTAWLILFLSSVSISPSQSELGLYGEKKKIHYINYTNKLMLSNRIRWLALYCIRILTCKVSSNQIQCVWFLSDAQYASASLHLSLDYVILFRKREAQIFWLIQSRAIDFAFY